VKAAVVATIAMATMVWPWRCCSVRGDVLDCQPPPLTVWPWLRLLLLLLLLLLIVALIVALMVVVVVVVV
jgi:hypothetical protein